MARLRLTLLGGFQVRLDDSWVVVLPIKKAQALLAYLAIPRPGPPARQARRPPVGRHARPTGPGRPAPDLFVIRKAVGDTVTLPLEDESIALDPAVVAVDVRDFEQCVAEDTSALGDQRRLGQIQAEISYRRPCKGDFFGAIRTGRRAVTIAASLNDLGLQMWTGNGLGRVYLAMGDLPARDRAPVLGHGRSQGRPHRAASCHP